MLLTATLPHCPILLTLHIDIKSDHPSPLLAGDHTPSPPIGEHLRPQTAGDHLSPLSAGDHPSHLPVSQPHTAFSQPKYAGLPIKEKLSALCPACTI